MTTTDPAAIGTTVLKLVRAGAYTQIRDLFPPNLRPMVTPESLQGAWDAEVARQGPVDTVGVPVCDPAGPAGALVKVPVTFARGQATVLVTVTDTGWVTGLQIAAAEAARPTESWQPSGYADPGAVHEQEVTIGSGPLAVDGTLALPGTPGRHPAVVLLSGSGPLDRDETVGRNKPFKDLAWGLAGRGIAVLRFDKVTYAHPDRVARIAGFTVDDEYLHDAVAALRLLREQTTVDPARVFVLGHSLGGSVAPRVAAADPTVAGLIILAGGAQPMHWSAVRQFRYLASQDPAGPAASQPVIDAVTRQAEAVDDPGLSSATPAAGLPFGVPAAYWLDLRGYQPPALAATLGRPMLILQGGRDYQVTVADDLSRWQDALTGRPDVTIHVYDLDNHFFFPGRGPSTPAEYEAVQHMDPAVITDIAAWVTGQRPASG